MTDTILVTYATRAGSTFGVAAAIGQALAEHGAVVALCSMEEVGDLSPYDAVVAGSAIRGGKWLPEAMQFVETHRAELARKPFAVFLVCITLAMPGGERYRSGVSTWLEPVRALVKPVSEGLFAGALDFRKLPLDLNTLGMRLAALLGIFPPGDHRDWDAIYSWADSLSAKLGLWTLQPGSSVKLGDS